jgi:hypothetical protein
MRELLNLVFALGRAVRNLGFCAAIRESLGNQLPDNISAIHQAQ